LEIATLSCQEIMGIFLRVTFSLILLRAQKNLPPKRTVRTGGYHDLQFSLHPKKEAGRRSLAKMHFPSTRWVELRVIQRLPSPPHKVLSISAFAWCVSLIGLYSPFGCRYKMIADTPASAVFPHPISFQLE
jgi:hypothetical protein